MAVQLIDTDIRGVARWDALNGWIVFRSQEGEVLYKHWAALGAAGHTLNFNGFEMDPGKDYSGTLSFRGNSVSITLDAAEAE